MASLAEQILSSLEEVQTLRRQRQSDPALLGRVQRVKVYQQRRFARSHADLLADPRHGPAARFFLEDLYGPQDFGERDAQFARIVPALVRLFPAEIVVTVERLARLHAVTEQLDQAMAGQLGDAMPDAPAYVRAWQATGSGHLRQLQVDLVLGVGRELDHYTRNRWLRQTLKLMRGPARAAGLASLQTFLERGFDTFAGMRGAAQFLDLIESREQALIRRLFEPDALQAVARCAPGVADALGQLP
jgi:hypothetical protein